MPGRNHPVDGFASAAKWTLVTLRRMLRLSCGWSVYRLRLPFLPAVLPVSPVALADSNEQAAVAPIASHERRVVLYFPDAAVARKALSGAATAEILFQGSQDEPITASVRTWRGADLAPLAEPDQLAA